MRFYDCAYFIRAMGRLITIETVLKNIMFTVSDFFNFFFFLFVMFYVFFHFIIIYYYYILFYFLFFV